MSNPSKHMIHSLGSSNSFGMLSLKAKVLWPMLIAEADDQGRFDARPQVVKWRVCQNVEEIAPSEVPGLLAEMADLGMVVLYGGNRRYGQIRKWWEYQQPNYAKPSKYPAPENWTDRCYYKVKDRVVKEGWDQVGGLPEQESRSGEGTTRGSGGEVLPEGDIIPTPTPTPNHTLLLSTKNFSQLFTDITGVLIATPAQAEKIDTWMADISEDWFRDACEEAVDNNVRKWVYIEAILERWSKEGKQKRGSYKRSQATDDLPYDQVAAERQAAREAAELDA